MKQIYLVAIEAKQKIKEDQKPIIKLIETGLSLKIYEQRHNIKIMVAYTPVGTSISRPHETWNGHNNGLYNNYLASGKKYTPKMAMLTMLNEI